MTEQFNKPSGPNELHPIRGGMDTDGYEDFRAKAPEQTAFEMHMKETAFSQSVIDPEADARNDALELFGDGEPTTAFQLESMGGRRPFAATEPVERSLLDQMPSAGTINKVSSEKSVSAEKAKSSVPTQPQPTLTSPRSFAASSGSPTPAISGMV